MVNGIEHADQRTRSGAGFTQIEPTRKAVGIAGQVNRDPSFTRVNADLRTNLDPFFRSSGDMVVNA